MNEPPNKPKRMFGDIAGCYLPKRWRKWFLYLPVDFSAVAVLLAALICIRASFITADEFFQPNNVGQDVEQQLTHLSALLRKDSARGKPDIYEGYSSLCGRHAEWEAGFYIFYGMALSELEKRQPERLGEIKSQLSLCARGILKVPPDVDDSHLESFFADKEFGNSAIQAGYVGIVLGLRKSVAQDGLFDVPLKRNAAALAQHLEQDLAQSGAVWTSDQATQLYALWLFDRVTGENHEPLFQKWLKVMKERFIEKETGLLVSQIGVNPDKVISPPRATSIAWTVIFLADVMPDFAREQYRGLCNYREQRLVNLAATREYPSRSLIQFGDLDSGPLICGFSPSATAFALCTHKFYGDIDHFARALRVFELFGAPETGRDGKFYYRANAMGDAILLYAKISQSKNKTTP